MSYVIVAVRPDGSRDVLQWSDPPRGPRGWLHRRRHPDQYVHPLVQLAERGEVASWEMDWAAYTDLSLALYAPPGTTSTLEPALWNMYRAVKLIDPCDSRPLTVVQGGMRCR